MDVRMSDLTPMHWKMATRGRKLGKMVANFATGLQGHQLHRVPVSDGVDAAPPPLVTVTPYSTDAPGAMLAL